MTNIEVCALCGKPFRSNRSHWASNGSFQVAVGPDCWKRIKAAKADGIDGAMAGETLLDPHYAPDDDDYPGPYLEGKG